MKEDIHTQTPTPSELEILNVLWGRGPSTVREVNEVLRERRDTGYTTTLKFLQNMMEKGLVARDDSARAHLYRAVLDEEKERRRLVDDLMDRAFGGTARKLVMHALSSRPASPEELAEIRKLLDLMEARIL